MLPDSDPYALDFKYVIENIPATETLYIDIEKNDSVKKDDLYSAADIVFKQLKDSPYFSDITYRFSNEEFINLVNLLSKKKFSLLNEIDILKIDDGLNQKSINKKLSDIKRNLLNPSGFFIVEQVTKDPLGFNKLVFEKLNSLKNETVEIKVEGGRILSSDHKHLLIMANPVFTAVETKKSKEMIDYLNNIREDIDKKFNGNIKTGFSGSHIATYDNSTTIQSDVKRAVTILSIAIFSIALLFFSRKIYIFLLFLPTVVSLTVASSILSLTNTSVSAIAIGCGSVLVGITVDFGIHILFTIDNSDNPDISGIIKNLRRPIATAALTTITAFSCLFFSTLPGQRQMGLFSLTGVLFAALFSSYILIYFIPENKKEKKKPILSLISFCSRLMNLRDKYKKSLLLVCLVIIIFCSFGIKDFKFEGDVTLLNHLSPVVKKDMDNFLKTWGGSSPTIVLVKGKNVEEALLKNDHLEQILLKTEKEGVINRISSIAPILPSSSTMKKNYTNWNSFMSREKLQAVKVMVNSASQSLGFSENIFNPFLEALSEKYQNISMKDFQKTALNKLIKGKLIIRENNVLVMTTFNIKNRTKIANIRDLIKSEIPEAIFLDKKSFITNTTNIVASEFKKLLCFAAIGMILSLIIFMRKVKIVIITIIPIFLSIFITTGVLGFLSIPVNLISILFIIFVFGVGVDFSIFLVNKELSAANGELQHDTAVTEGAVIICAMTTIGAFISLIFAQHSALYSIGVAGLTGMLSSLIMAVILIPALSEKFITNKKDW
jgi:predicted exporter